MAATSIAEGSLHTTQLHDLVELLGYDLQVILNLAW